MNDSIIRLENVWKIYKMGQVEVPALRGINIDIKKGDFVSIMGPSGSGKSTAMNMVGALDIPTRGKVFLDNIDIATLGESELAQIRGKKIGFIFQQFNLIPTLSALENVTLPMIFQNVSKVERVKRATTLLNKVGLGDRIHHRPNELSGGQQQRVAISRALSNDPEVVLADEPTGNLDQNTGLEFMETLKTLNKDFKKTIVMVTHDQKVAQKAHRIELLMDGQIRNRRSKK